MSTDNQSKSIPRSMRHRQILDVAEANPSASVSEIAAQVPSATSELVEQVFEEHGDPASESEPSSETDDTMSTPTDPPTQEHDAASEPTADTAPETTVSDEQATDEQTVVDGQNGTDDNDDETETEPEFPSLEELSEKHQELLETVAAQPAATQADLAAEFDVTRATISRWASEMSGFEWREREAFVDAVFDDDRTIDMTDQSTPDADSAEADQTTASDTDDEGTATVTEIETDLTELSERVADLEAADGTADSDSVFEDPDLVHKIVHACLDSERISEAEELRILKRLLN